MTTPELEIPFELILGEKNREIHSGDVPVRWCISTDLVAKMEKDGIVDPHVLLVTTTDNALHEMQRQIVPVSQLKTYVRFTRAGKMKLHAWIVDGSDKQNIKKHLIKLENSYHTTLFRYNGERLDSHYDSFVIGTTVNLEIPEGVFGKEPHPAIKWFVNLWHGKDRVADECEFRRRAILAFTLKWIPVLVYALGYTALRLTLVVIMVSLGFTNVAIWKNIPKVFDIPHINGIINPNVTYPLNQFLRIGDEELLLWTPLSLTPAWLLLGTAVAHVVAPDLQFEYMVAILGSPFIVAVLVDVVRILHAVMFNVHAIKTFIDYIGDKFVVVDDWMTKHNLWPNIILISTGLLLISILIVAVLFWKATLLLAASVASLALTAYVGAKIIDYFFNTPDYTEMRELLCPKDLENLDTSTKSVPSEYRTIRLRYLDFKNKVCKPMQM